jgi:hypothetical protein
VLPAVLQRMRNLGYAVFEGELNLNLVGIRRRNGKPDAFDDRLSAIYQDQGSWIERSWPGTTDPGLYWLKNPMNVEGTAVLIPGQYRGAWLVGAHQGRYEALVQNRPVRVWRDGNMDGVIDKDRQVDEGIFGINIHRAHDAHPSPIVHKWSAGCQVFQNPVDFSEFMLLVNKSALKYGRRFTYTLLDQD